MRRLIAAIVATAAITLVLALPAGAGARTNWNCLVPGNPVPETFVSAADAALYGITTANGKAGAVFASHFGESCTVVSD